MQGFKDVAGHEDIISHLQNAIKMNQVSHAYIFGGEHGSGKKLLASLFAMTLQCETHGIEPCMQCTSCKKALSKNHPDIINITHEKPNSIGIEEIRQQLIDDVAIRPYESRYKIYIVNEAQKMTLQAQNALLKTIEEPPSYAIILLLADNPDSLLPTISSRCVILNLKPVSDNLVKSYLMERMHIPDYQAEVDASFAQGNIGKAVRIASSEEYGEVMENALRLAKYAQNMQLYELIDAIKGMTAEKDNIQDYLDMMMNAAIISEVPIYGTEKKAEYFPKKYYAVDHAFSAIFTPYSAMTGVRAEHAVHAKLLRLGKEIFYYRSKDDYETDFLVADEDLVPLLLVQVTDDFEVSREREIRGPLATMKELQMNEGYILSRDSYEDLSIDGCTIYVRPVYEFLLSDLENVIQK